MLADIEQEKEKSFASSKYITSHLSQYSSIHIEDFEIHGIVQHEGIPAFDIRNIVVSYHPYPDQNMWTPFRCTYDFKVPVRHMNYALANPASELHSINEYCLQRIRNTNFTKDLTYSSTRHLEHSVYKLLHMLITIDDFIYSEASDKFVFNFIDGLNKYFLDISLLDGELLSVVRMVSTLNSSDMAYYEDTDGILLIFQPKRLHYDGNRNCVFFKKLQDDRYQHSTSPEDVGNMLQRYDLMRKLTK